MFHATGNLAVLLYAFNISYGNNDIFKEGVCGNLTVNTIATETNILNNSGY
jgi:hypothetical protein